MCHPILALVLEWSEHRRAKGRQASSVLWWGLFRCVGEVWGCWDGQDRLSSLPPVCCEWIGDYSSRCVIRSELYSWGCRVRSGVKREHLGGHAPQESHFIGVKWMYGMCQVIFLHYPPPPPLNHIYSLSSSFPHPHPPSCLSMALLGRKVPVHIHLLLWKLC